MNWQDIVNGLYELLGGIFIWFSVYRLYKDKEIKGISMFTQIFFTTWGWWNLYYYPSLNQWASFVGAVLLAVANLHWIILAIYYINKNKKKELLYG